MKKSVLSNLFFWVISIFALLTIAACHCDESVLVSNTWVLEKYGPEDVLVDVLHPGAPPPGSGIITLGFDGDQVKGSDGCNSYFGPFSQSGCDFSPGTLSSTLILCFDDIKTQEDAYMDILGDVKTFSTKNGQLKLCTDDNRVLIYRKE